MSTIRSRYALTPCVYLLMVGSHLINAQHCTPILGSRLKSGSDVLIGALLDLSMSSSCEMNEKSVENLEAFRWALRRIEGSGYLDSITIDVVAYDTCNDPEQANRALRQLLMATRQSYVNVTCEGKPQVLLGILGPSTSGTAVNVATVLNTNSPVNGLLQISHSATATFLTKDEKYSNFYSLVSRNDQQAKAIVEILKARGWNYVALVTTNDAYGTDGGDAITAIAMQYGICIALKETLTGGESDTYILNKIFYGTSKSGPVKVVVFFGQADYAFQLLNAAMSPHIHHDLEFIFSDDVQLNTRVFAKAKKVSLGSLVVVPSFEIIPEFQSYWNRLIHNASEITKQSPGNPHLENLFRKRHSCENQPNITQCTVLPTSDPLPVSLFSYHAVISAYVFAYLLKNVADCKNRFCTLKNLQTPKNLTLSEFSRYMKSNDIDLTEIPNVPEILKSAYGKISFKDGRTPVQKSNYFDIYSFQKCATGSLCFVKVGEFGVGGLKIDKVRLKMYDSSEKEITHKRSAVCPENFVCNSCILKAEQKRWLYIPGDVVVLASCPIHDAGQEPYTVGVIRDLTSVQIAEAFLFALKIVNEKRKIFADVFPDKKIGLLMMDSAYSESVAQKAVHNVFFGGDANLPNWEEISRKIIGVVGGLGSSITKDVANVIMKMNMPQISYGSTAETLSDRVNYPYLARTCAPDGKQVKLMLTLINKFNWKYISLVYIDNNYGQKGAQLIQEGAKTHGICLAQIIPFTNNMNAFSIAETLRQTPHAKLVILFVIGSLAKTIINAFAKQLKVGEFVFIGSESWGNRPEIIEGSMVTEGSITVIQDFPKMDTFDAEFSKKNPDNVYGTEREWLLPYWQAKMSCSWRNGFDQRFPDTCNKSSPITARASYFQEPWVPFVVYAFYSLVIGVDGAWKEMCATAAQCPRLRKQPLDVYKRILRTRFNTMGTGSRVRLYDDAGNGLGGYKIYNVQKTKLGDSLFYKEVGYWTEVGLELRMDDIKFPNGHVVSDIPNEKVKKECFQNAANDSGKTSATNKMSSLKQPEFLAPLITAVILAVLVIILIIVLVSCHRRKFQGAKSDVDYITPREMKQHDNYAECRYGPSEGNKRDSGLTESGSGGDCSGNTSIWCRPYMVTGSNAVGEVRGEGE